jgi:hypothetical protein
VLSIGQGPGRIAPARMLRFRSEGKKCGAAR